MIEMLNLRIQRFLVSGSILCSRVYDPEYGILQEGTFNFHETTFVLSPVDNTRVVPRANTIRQPSRIRPGNYE